MVRRLLVFPSLLALALVGLTVLPAGATPVARTSVTMVGSGDYISGSNAWHWRDGDGTINVGGSLAGISVQVGGGSHGSNGCCGFSLSFAAPMGEQLAVGHYPDARRTPFRGTSPGISITGDGRGCNTVTGEFTVLDLAEDLSRFWIVYEMHCEGGIPATFGEVRYNMPTDPELLSVPTRIDWPATGARVGGRNVPVTLVNTGSTPVTVSSAQVTAGADVFGVASNDCGVLAVDASCTVSVSFRPLDVVDYVGELTITDSTTAGSRVIPLSGSGYAVPVGITIRRSGSVFDYAKSATFTARLTGSYLNSTVRFYRRIGSGVRQLVGTRTADGTGTARFTIPVRENATFTAEWTDGAVTEKASTTVTVRSRINLTMGRWKSRSGAYHLYRPGTVLVSRAAVAPVKPGKCVYFFAQAKVRGQWRGFGSTGCVRMTKAGVARAGLAYTRDLLGVPLRFQAWVRVDARNSSKISVWRYAKYVR